MKRLVTGMVVCLAALAVTASPAFAQRGGGRGGRGFGGFGRGGMNPVNMLNRNEQLQKELKITDEQKEKIKTISDEARNAGGGFQGFQDLTDEERLKRMEEMRKRGEETAKKIEAVLTPEQVQRLKGIKIWMQGTAALTDPEIVKELKLSDEAVKQLKTIAEESSKKRREAFTGLDRESSSEDRKKATDKAALIRKDADEEALQVLTAEQKTALDKLKGEKFEFDMSAGFGGGREGRGGRGGRGGRDRNKSDDKKAEEKVEEKKT